MMKQITRLSPEEQQTLTDAYHNHPVFRTRQRAHAVLLNDQGYSMANLARLFGVQHETVSRWLRRWEKEGITGLFDVDKSGRPRKLTVEEEELLLALVDENPHQLKRVHGTFEAKTGKQVSRDTLKRTLKDKGYRHKRCRQSTKHKRDESLFQRDQEIMQWLQQEEDKGVINLRYFDESGFNLKPVVPYAWQPVGETFRIPCQRSPRLNVLGFMGRQGEGFFHSVETVVDTKAVIAAFDDFAEDYYETEFRHTKKLCFVVLDNASTHHAQAFKDKQDDWLLRGVVPRFIPPYCPELNLIEILWRKIKYEWLPMKAYQSFAQLKKSVQEVLDGFGSKFLISFA